MSLKSIAKELRDMRAVINKAYEDSDRILEEARTLCKEVSCKEREFRDGLYGLFPKISFTMDSKAQYNSTVVFFLSGKIPHLSIPHELQWLTDPYIGYLEHDIPRHFVKAIPNEDSVTIRIELRSSAVNIHCRECYRKTLGEDMSETVKLCQFYRIPRRNVSPALGFQENIPDW